MAKVIGDSYVGRVALQYNYREGCFPTVAPTVSTPSLAEETVSETENSKSGRMGPESDIPVTNITIESLPEGSGFSHVCNFAPRGGDAFQFYTEYY